MKKEETIFCVPHQCLIKGLTGRGRFVTHYFGEPLKIFPVPRVVEKEKKTVLLLYLEYLETGWIIWKVLEGFGIVHLGCSYLLFLSLYTIDAPGLAPQSSFLLFPY